MIKKSMTLKWHLIILAFFSCPAAFSQYYFLDEFIDSTLGRSSFSANDWAIGIKTSQNGRPYEVDSDGNLLTDPEIDWRIMIFKIKDTLYLQKFRADGPEFEKYIYTASKRVKLPAYFDINYTADSIAQADKEYLFPYIYRIDSLNTYEFQAPSLHAAFYTMYFQTNKLYTDCRFDETYIVEQHLIRASNQKSINFKHNSSTFTYRAFIKIKDFFAGHRTVLTDLAVE